MANAKTKIPSYKSKTNMVATEFGLFNSFAYVSVNRKKTGNDGTSSDN